MKRNAVGIGKAAVLGALVAAAALLSSCAGPGKRVTVLTYNTHLFGGSNAESAITLKNLVSKADENVVLDDEERFDKIVEELKRGDADIVALQELWACNRPKELADSLSKVYPHSYYSKQPCQSASWNKIAGESLEEFGRRHPAIRASLFIPMSGTITGAILAATKYKEFEPITLQILKQKYKIADGLLLLSKYPIDDTDTEFHEFPVDRTEDPKDRLARKGVITTTIVLPNGLRLRVGITHATTDVGGWQSMPDMAELAEYATEGTDKTGPAIIMGDFNVHHYADDASEYDRMADILAHVGALDAYRQVKKRNDMTVDWDANPLLRYFFPKKQRLTCIDYVFYRPGGPGLTIRPESATVITDWKYSHEIKRRPAERWDLSDHYPVMVTFSLWNGPNRITWPDPAQPRAR